MLLFLIGCNPILEGGDGSNRLFLTDDWVRPLAAGDRFEMRSLYFAPTTAVTVRSSDEAVLRVTSWDVPACCSLDPCRTVADGCPEDAKTSPGELTMSLETLGEGRATIFFDRTDGGEPIPPLGFTVLEAERIDVLAGVDDLDPIESDALSVSEQTYVWPRLFRGLGELDGTIEIELRDPEIVSLRGRSSPHRLVPIRAGETELRLVATSTERTVRILSTP